MSMALRVDVEALLAGLNALGARSELAAMAGAKAGAAVAEKAIKQQLSIYSHRKGTPTPSPHGSPPAVVSGALRRSVGTEARAGYMRVGPSVVYGRIQELGGTTGRGHRTTLPPRPYVQPAYNTSYGEMQTAVLAAIRRTLLG